MADVAPELLQRVQEAFDGYVKDNSVITRIRGKPRATQADVHRFAEELGKMLSKAYMDVLTEDALPNGTLYRNIAERIIPPTLKTVHGSVIDFASAVQAEIDKANNLGIGTVAPDFPEVRIYGLVEKASDPLAEYAEQMKWLGEPVVNNAEAFMDDFVRENARTRARMGLKTSITRTVAPGCCEWCDRLGGVYEYGDEPREVYERHEYCRCMVTFQSGRTSQNVWSKTIWESTPDEIERRISSSGRVVASQNEILSAVENAKRDQAIDALSQALGKSKEYTRAYARNLNVAEIEKEIAKKRRSLSRRG